MSGITGLGTTFNLPNYHGELFSLSPTETPFLSMAGGIGGGKQVSSTEFEWQTVDLRDPSIRTRIEGADAPTAEERVRSNVKNVVQIFHEKVSTSYTKQAATGQFATTGSAPFNSYDGLGVGNPVPNEHTQQIYWAVQQIARDVNWAFWHGKKNVPTDTSTGRQTAGLLSVLSTNKSFVTGSTEVTAASATDTITKASHGLSDGDQIVFTDVDVATNIRPDRAYYVVSSSTTFKVAATAGGSAITLGTAAPKYVRVSGTGAVSVSVDFINALVQGIFDNGGLAQGETRTLFVPSIQKTRITKAFATAYGSNVNGAIGMATGHTVGGVAVDRIETDFGSLNLVVERALPKDAIVAVSMEQIDPVFLPHPGRGILYEEQLARTGSADNTQILGEIGLKYGSERAHGVLRGLSVA
jgi:hypothetical protein